MPNIFVGGVALYIYKEYIFSQFFFYRARFDFYHIYVVHGKKGKRVEKASRRVRNGKYNRGTVVVGHRFSGSFGNNYKTR